MVRPESEKQGSWNRGKTATDECAALRECVNDLHSLLKELAHAEIVPSEESGTESVQLSDQLQALMRKIEAAEEAVQLTAEWRPQDPQTGIASYEKITLCEKQFEATMFAWYRYRQTIDFWCRKQGTEAACDSSFEKNIRKLDEKWNLLASKFNCFYDHLQEDIYKSKNLSYAIETAAVYAPPEKMMGRSNTGTHGQTYPFLHANPDSSAPPMAAVYASPPFPRKKVKKEGIFKRLFKNIQGR